MHSFLIPPFPPKDRSPVLFPTRHRSNMALFFIIMEKHISSRIVKMKSNKQHFFMHIKAVIQIKSGEVCACVFCIISWQRTCAVTSLPPGSSLSLILLSSQCFSQDYATPAAVWRHRRREGGRKLFKVPLLLRDQITGERLVTASCSGAILDNCLVPSHTTYVP